MAHGAKDPSPAGALSPTAEGGDLVKALSDAMAQFRAGRVGQAKAEFEEILRRSPNSAAAIHFLGLISHREGDQARAVELLERAVEMNSVAPFFHGNLGEVYRALGRLDEAVAACRQALDLFPVYPEALNTLGAALYEQRELNEAERNLLRAIEFKPDLAAAHGNLGNVLRARGNLEKAAKAFRRALRHDAKLPGAHMALAGTLRAMGQVDEAIEVYRQALDLNPKDAKCWSNLGTALRSVERNDEALDCLQKAVALQPGLADAHTNLGTALVVLGRMDEALACYKTALELKRTAAWDRPGQDAPAGAPDPTFRYTTEAKLRHDIEQFGYLREKDLLPAAFDAEIARYREVVQEIAPARGRVALSAAQQRKIAGSYNKLVYLAEAPAMDPSPVNPDIDVAAVEADFLANAPGITCLDGMLSPAALEAVRNFCLESTIWFDFEYRNDYLGAYLSDGFSNALLFQIAEDLRLRFPRIFGDHRLRQMWAYKYDSRSSGIEHHADSAAINVNFWITPDNANLDPDGGGLVVYTREAPLEWDFETYNQDQPAIREFLADSKSITVPYRQNRAMIFNSNLFHKADDYRFKDGYENRRINITFLYGLRGAAGAGNQSAPDGSD